MMYCKEINFKLRSSGTDTVLQSAVIIVAGVDDRKFAKCLGFLSI